MIRNSCPVGISECLIKSDHIWINLGLSDIWLFSILHSPFPNFPFSTGNGVMGNSGFGMAIIVNFESLNVCPSIVTVRYEYMNSTV